MAGGNVVKGSVLLTPKFDNLGANIKKALGGGYRSAKSIHASSGAQAALGYSKGFSSGAGAIMGAVSAITQKAIGVITNSISSAVNRVDTIANFPKIMSSLGYATDDARSSIQQLSDGIDGLPTSLDAVVGSVQKIAPVTGSLQKATDISLAFNNALLAGGKSQEIMNSAFEQYSQMLSTNKVDMQSWKILAQAMPGQLNQIAKSLLGANATQADLYKAMQSGKISFDDFNNAVVKLNSEGLPGYASFADQAKIATEGIGTAWTNVTNRVNKSIAKVIDHIGQANISGVINKFSSGFSGVADVVIGFMDTVKPISNALIGAFGNAGVQAAIDSLKTTVAGLKTNFDTAASSAVGFVQSFVGSDVIATVMGTAISVTNDVLATFSNILADITNAATTFYGRLQDNGALQTLGDILGSVAGAVDNLSFSVGQIIRDFADAVTGEDAMKVAADLLKGALDGVKGVVQLAADAIKLLSEHLDVVEPLIVSIGTALLAYKTITAIKTIASDFSLLKEAASLAFAAIKGGEGVFSTLSVFGELVGEGGALAGVFGTISSAIGGVGASLMALVGSIPVIGWIAVAIAAVTAAVVYLFNTNEDFRNAVIAAWGAIKETAVNVWGAVCNFFTTTIPEAFSSVVNFFTVDIPNAFNSFVAYCQQLPQQILTFFQQLPEQIIYWLTYAIVFVGAFIVELGAKALEAGSTFLSNLGTFFLGLPEAIHNWLDQALINVALWAFDMTVKAQEASSSFVNGVSSFLASLPGAIQSWLSSALSSIAGWASSVASQAVSAGQGFLNGIQSGFNSAMSFIQSIPSRVTSFFANAGSWLINSGRALIDGFAQGIRNAVGAAVSAASDAVSAVRNLFPFSPAKVGPFSGHGYTTYSGRALMRDFGRGITASAILAEKSAQSALAGVNDMFTSAEPLNFRAIIHANARGIYRSAFELDSKQQAANNTTLADIYNFLRGGELAEVIDENSGNMGQRDFTRAVQKAVRSNA